MFRVQIIESYIFVQFWKITVYDVYHAMHRSYSMSISNTPVLSYQDWIVVVTLYSEFFK